MRRTDGCEIHWSRRPPYSIGGEATLDMLSAMLSDSGNTLPTGTLHECIGPRSKLTGALADQL